MYLDFSPKGKGLNLSKLSPLFSQKMDSSESQPFKSKKKLNASSKPVSSSSSAQTLAPSPPDSNPWSSKTPEKPIPGRIRNRGVALSVKEVKKVAEGLRESDRDRSDIRLDPISSRSNLSAARKRIASWPSESPVGKSKNVAGGSIKLPEKYGMLVEFFNSLDSSIRLLRLKGSTSTFTNICPKIESLTDRRFSYGHLAQLKFILPEAIVLKKILMLDERTSCMKPDLHVTLEADAIENDGKLKLGSGNLHLRKVFCTRLLDFFKAHPEGDDIPEGTLPGPFNQSKQDLHSNTIEAFKSSLPVETSTDALLEQQPIVASHMPPTFRRQFSKKVCDEAENSRQKPSEDSLQPLVLPVPESCLNKSSSNKEAISCAALSPIKFSSKPTTSEICKTFKTSPCSQPSHLPATPIKEINSSKNENCSLKEIPSILVTPAKLISTSARLMTVTPALQSPKRCRLSPDVDSNSSPDRLVGRTLRTRSLKFDTPIKNAKVEDEVNETRYSSIDSDIFDILPENLLQSIQEKERKAIEERDPVISQLKRRRELIACLPKLFNMIHLSFQSIKRSVITKEELIHKIITSHCDVIDRREVEEQLTLLQELVPEWISEKLAISGDCLFCINKTSSPDLIRARLAEAK